MKISAALRDCEAELLQSRKETQQAMADARQAAAAFADETDQAVTEGMNKAKLESLLSADRARRLISAAERIARSITDQRQQAWALAKVAEGLAATDPGRAEQIALSILRKKWVVWALGAYCGVSWQVADL
jgi:hypothetical protein